MEGSRCLVVGGTKRLGSGTVEDCPFGLNI